MTQQDRKPWEEYAEARKHTEDRKPWEDFTPAPTAKTRGADILAMAGSVLGDAAPANPYRNAAPLLDSANPMTYALDTYDPKTGKRGKAFLAGDIPRARASKDEQLKRKSDAEKRQKERLKQAEENPATLMDIARDYSATGMDVTGAAIEGLNRYGGEAYNKLAGNPLYALTGDKSYQMDTTAFENPFAGMADSQRKLMNAGYSEAQKGNVLGEGRFWLGEDPTVTGVLGNTAKVAASVAPVIASAILTRGAAVPATFGGLMSSGSNYNDKADEIEQMYRNGTLAQESELFRSLIQNGVDHDTALRITKDRTASAAGNFGGLVAGAGGAVTSKLLDPATRLFGKLGPRAAAALTATVAATEEPAEEVAEGVASQIGANLAGGMNSNIFEGWKGNFVGGLIGGGPQAAISGVHAYRNAKNGSMTEREMRIALLSEAIMNSQNDTPLTTPTAPNAAPRQAEQQASAPVEPQALPELGASVQPQSSAVPAPVMPNTSQAPQSELGEFDPRAPALPELGGGETREGLIEAWRNAKTEGEKANAAARIAAFDAQQNVQTDALQAALTPEVLGAAAQALGLGDVQAAPEGTGTPEPTAESDVDRIARLTGLPRGAETNANVAPQQAVFAEPDALRETATEPPRTKKQNRDRSRPDSVAQMQDIRRNPDASRLGFSRDANTGAPLIEQYEDVPQADLGREDVVVQPNGRRVKVRYAVVEADQAQASHFADGRVNPDYDGAGLLALNNGRTAGLQAAWESGNADGYRAGLMEDEALHGVPRAAIEGKRKPMLVRLVSPNENMSGAESNARQQLGLSPVEQAQTDADYLPDLTGLKWNEDGSIPLNGNGDFFRKWFNRMGDTEASSMRDAKGMPNAQAIARLRNAMIARAYGDERLLTAAAEEVDPDNKNILNALAKASVAFASLDQNDALANDVREALVGGLELIREAANHNDTLEGLLAQGDMLGRNSDAVDVARYMDANKRSANKMAEVFRAVADFIDRAQMQGATVDIFGNVQKPTVGDALNAAGIRTEAGNVARDADESNRVSEPEAGGRAATGDSFRLEQQPARAEQGTGRRQAEQVELLAPPPAQERNKAAQADKDAQRNGLGRDVVRPEQGDGELLAGKRPAQSRVDDAQLESAGRSKASESDADVDALVRDFAGKEGAPTEAEIRAARKEWRETERALGGREAYDKAKGAGKTKLTYGQWVTVRTPRFKAWFGDFEGDPANASKVVDQETGEPMVVYHGTNRDITEFDPSLTKAADVIFTTPIAADASIYAEAQSTFAGHPNVMPLFTVIKHPAYIDGDAYSYDLLSAAVTRSGVDGVIVTRADGQVSIAAPISAAQIKSATANIGTFNESGNILQSKAKGESVAATTTPKKAKRTAEQSQTQGKQDADKNGIRKAVEAVLGKVGVPVDYLRGIEGLEGIATPAAIAALKAAQERRGSGTAGLYLRAHETMDGKPRAVIFTDGVLDANDAAFVAAHEVAGHHGLRALLGDKLDVALKMAMQNPVVRKLAEAIAKERGVAMDARATEEALAELQGALRTGDFKALTDRYGVAVPESVKPSLKNAIANFVRRLGIALNKAFGRANDAEGFTDAQLRDLLQNAWRAAKNKNASVMVRNADGVLEQVVFHGTPHKVDRFNMQKIGTGEGAQAYGWGIYFAGARQVAEGYRKRLQFNDNELQDAAMDAIEAADNSTAQAARDLENEAANIRGMVRRGDLSPASIGRAEILEGAARWINDGMPRENPGQLYSANIPEDSDLLDWDKPLSEQPDSVQAAFFDSDEYYDALFRENPIAARNHRAQRESLQKEEFYEYAKKFEQRITGRELYGNLDRLLGDARAASEYLQSIGIPGLRYLDGNSRSAGEGSHNYVIWDEAAIGEPEALESSSRATQQAYEARIDALLGGAKPTNRSGVRMLDRADILGLLGHGDKPLTLVESAVGKPENGMPRGSTPKHPKMTAEQWKKVPEWIENPVAAFRSQTDPSRIVLFAPELVGGRPVRIILAPNGSAGGLDVHVAVNAYDEGGTHITPVDKWANNGDLLYLNEKVSPAFNEQSGLRLPSSVRQLRGYVRRVLTGSDLVKYRAERDADAPLESSSRRHNSDQGELLPPATVSQQRDAVMRKTYRERNYLFGKLAADGYAQGSPTQQPNGRFVTVAKAAQAVRGNLFDRMQAGRDMMRRVSKEGKGVTGVDIDDAMNFYRLENAMAGAQRDANNKLLNAHVLPIQAGLRNAGLTLEQFEDYLYAKAVPERNAEIAKINKAMPDAGAGITTQLANDILAGTADGVYSGKRMTAQARRVFQQLETHVRAMRDQSLDNMVAAGQITQKLANDLRKKYPSYVPMRGKDAELDAGRGNGDGKGLSQTRANIKRALGRGADNVPMNIMGEIVGDAQRSIAAREKGKVTDAFLRFALAHPMPDLFEVEPVDLEWKFSEATGEAYLGVRNSAEDAATTLIAMHNGKPVRVRIKDKELQKAVLRMGAQDLGFFVRNVGKLNRWRSAVLTRYNPAFVPVNLTRDMIFGMTALYAERGAAAAARTAVYYAPAMLASGMHQAGKRGDTSKPVDQMTPLDFATEFYENGGSTGLSINESPADLQKRLSAASASLMTLATSGRKLTAASEAVVRAGKPIVDAIEIANEAVEMALRVAAYIDARKQGESAGRAMEYSKNLTINFDRKGHWGPVMNSIFLFYNAAVQGNAAVMRVMRSPKTWQVLGGLAMLQAYFAAGMMGDEDDDGLTVWDKIPDYTKRTSLIIPNGRGGYFTIPMPYGFNLLTYSAGRMMQYHKLGARPSDESLVASLLSATSEAFSPMPFHDGNGAMFGDTLGLMFRLASNKNDFGSPIAKETPYATYDQPKALQGKVTTPQAYHWAARMLAQAGGADLDEKLPPVAALDFAPEQLEEITKFFGGGLMNMTNQGMSLVEQLSAGNIETMSQALSAAPITRRFYTEGNESRAVMSRYYFERGEADRNKAIVTERMQAGQSLDEALASRKPEYRGFEQVAYKKSGKRPDGTTYEEGQQRFTSSGAPMLAAYEGSASAIMQAAEKNVNGINKTISKVRGNISNDELGVVYDAQTNAASRVLGEDVVSKILGDSPSAIRVSGDGRASAASKARALKSLQDLRAAMQKRALQQLQETRRNGGPSVLGETVEIDDR